VTWTGWAIECRINAEDPFGGWLPSPGTITGLRAANGPGVREDSGAYEGYTVPRWYDTLLAKLIVWGVDRPTAIARMLRALGEYRVVGVRTTIPALERIVGHPDFRAGRLSTALLERILPALRPAEGRFAPIAVIAAVLAEYERAGRATPAAVADGGSPSRWRWAAPCGWSRP
jgi:acetyl-CoA carboxylase, biotin carboxylase subunit